MKVKDVVDYIWNHKKRDKVFPNWTYDQLHDRIMAAAHHQCFSWSVGLDGKIDGVVLVEADYDAQELHVTGIICDHHQVLWGFLKKYFDYYSGWILTATRRGKLVRYNNTTKFIRSLWKSTLKSRSR